jgi:hypothetical protein
LDLERNKERKKERKKENRKYWLLFIFHRGKAPVLGVLISGLKTLRERF